YVAGVYGGVLDAGDWWGLTSKPDDVWIARYDSRATIWNLAHDQSSADRILDSQWTNNKRAHQYVGNTSQTWGSVTLSIDIDIDAFTVAGGNGTKRFNNWGFVTVDWPPYVGVGGSFANGVNDAGTDLASSGGAITDLIVGQRNPGEGSGYLYTAGSFTNIDCDGTNNTPAHSVNN